MIAKNETPIYQDGDLVVFSIKKLEQCPDADPIGDKCHECDYSCSRDVEGILYRYVDISKADITGYESRIKFQRGNRLDDGINGLTNEALLATLIHRVKHLNSKVPCEENIRAEFYLTKALKAFEDRSRDRQVRKIEGKPIR